MIIGTTESVCPVCLRRLKAEKRAEKGGIYMDKVCPEHGRFSALIWEGDVESYRQWSTQSIRTEAPVEPKAVEKGCPYDCGLCEEHQRKGCCVVLELTNRCNLRCPVCFASAGEAPAKEPSLEDISRQYDMLMAHGGPFNIQLSGGEPTMRDDLPEIIRIGRDKGFTFFQLNTNGLRLAREAGYAEKLKSAGLNTVFLQFDGVTDDVYLTLRGQALMKEKEAAIASCAAAGLGIVLVPVIARGINDGQVGELLRFGLSYAPEVRGIHFQPISYFGRCAFDRPENPVTIPKMLALIEEQTGGIMRAADFSGGGAENPYCSFHASYRRMADGTLKALPRKDEGSCCCSTGSDDSREFVANQWSSVELKPAFNADGELEETSALDAFLAKLKLNTFAVSGMVFQDAYNLDLERLKRCYICEVDGESGMVPFCAYNLTNTEGRALYRK